MGQLDLLTYTLTPEELQELEPKEERIPDRPSQSFCLDWQEHKLTYYTRLMNRFLSSGIRDKQSGVADPEVQAMRRYMIAHLQQQREQIQAQIKQLREAP